MPKTKFGEDTVLYISCVASNMSLYFIFGLCNAQKREICQTEQGKYFISRLASHIENCFYFTKLYFCKLHGSN